MRARLWWRIALGGTWLLAATTTRAQFLDVSGNWQVNVDCGYYATATSFLNLTENTSTGEVTASPPAIQGTIEFPNAIQRIDSNTVVSGPTTGAVGSFGSFSLPAFPDSTRTHVTLAPPYDYVLLGCPVAGIVFDTRYAGSATGSGGIASFVDGTIYNANFDFRDATDTTCYAFAGEIDCGFSMRRNDVPAGSNVSVTPRYGTTVTFDTVTAPGVAAVMPLTTPDGSVPPNFQVYSAGAAVPIYYEVTTTAAIGGPITTCFDYADVDDDGVVDGTYPWVFEQYLRILHEEAGAFVDRTLSLDTDDNVLCAQTSSLSQVTVAAEEDQPTPWQDHSLSRTKLVVKRSRSGAEKVVFVAKDPAFLYPEPGTVNDPRHSFLSRNLDIEIFSPTEGVAGGEGYGSFKLSSDGNKYVSFDPEAPFVKAKLIRGRVLKIQLDATQLSLTAPQGALGVRVTTGLLRNCALFSGDAVFKDQPNRFVGKRSTAAALADCSATSLGGSGSPSGAFVDDDR
jgi:hypothetical protein